jgi:acetyl esterase/lipase
MSKQTRYYLNALFLLVLLGAATAADAQVDQQRAQADFKEAQALCERDGGRLWGVSLCAPMVIADLRTQTIATSQPAPEGARPRGLGIVNAPVQWGGATWVAYTWSDVANRTPRERKELFAHELFHGVQPQLGLMAPARATEHLDAADGRYWLRLEWRALARALRESGEPRNLAVRDALAFRQARRMLYPSSVEDERGQEITEGLAAYTGAVLAAESAADAIAGAIDLLANAEKAALEASFVRTFAYMSGPAYGLLLDASSPGWTRKVRGTDDLATLVMRALAVQPATDAAVSATRYGGAEIRASEQKRDQERQERLGELRRRFVDGPVLLIPGGSHSYDTRGAVVIPGVGTVYFGPFRASGDWGTLEAEKGVLVASDGRSRRVSAPVRRDDLTLTGDGWTFKAAAGWVVREGARRGDYEVVRAVPAPARQPSVTRDVMYGHKDGLALTFDVHRPAQPNGAGVIAIVSGGWQSSVEMSRAIVDNYLAPLLTVKGFTVFAVRHGSSPRYHLPAIVADMRRSVRFVRQHAGEYGVDPNRIGVYGGSAGGQLALLLGTTADAGDPSASDAVLKESSRVAAVVAYFPPTDLVRFVTPPIRKAFPAVATLTDAELAQYSPIRFVSPGAAPSLIVHGDADTGVPIVEGETMHGALTKAGVPASFLRIEGAGHGFAGADLERVNAAMVQWFEQYLRGAAK